MHAHARAPGGVGAVDISTLQYLAYDIALKKRCFPPDVIARLQNPLYTALLHAVSSNDAAAVTAALESGGKDLLTTLNAKDETVLMIAVSAASLTIVNILVKVGGAAIIDAAVTLAQSTARPDVLASLKLLTPPPQAK